MNTGAQNSSSAPLHAATGLTPAGKRSKKKNIIEMLAAQEIPHVAPAMPGHLDDLVRKVGKALQIKGMRFIAVRTPCLDGWGLAGNQGVTSARLAVESGVFPLYEVENGTRCTLNWPEKTKPVDEYLLMQKRFRHLTPESLAEIQEAVAADWERLLQRVRNSEAQEVSPYADQP